MTQPLCNFMTAIRSADSVEKERFIIRTEEAQLRVLIRDCDPELRPRIISKLMFLDMLGENLTWGQMECINLMNDSRFSYKRIGYSSASVLLDETADISVLVTHTLLKDLGNPDSNIQSLALTYISNHGSSEVCRSTSSMIKKCAQSDYPQVLKRAGMAIVHVVRKNPDLADSFKNSVQKLLNNPNHGVIISGMNAVISLISIDPKLAKSWNQFTTPFTKILHNLINNRGNWEFKYGIFNDPYMLIKVLRALIMLGKGSEEINDLLQTIISSAETRLNTGRAILCEAVQAICSLPTSPSLKALAFNQVGRLLSMKESNVLYTSLSIFARVISDIQSSSISTAELITLNGDQSSSLYTIVLQRYKAQIMKCLDHCDPSIRRRALYVISALIDPQNVTTLVPEILTYVKLADAEFRSELITKIYSATQKYAPSKEWNFDTVLQILVESGNYVSAEIISNFTELITNTPSLHSHALAALRESLANFSGNQVLMQVAAFVIGEFAMEDAGITDLLFRILEIPQTINETKFYITTALAKLATRLGIKDVVKTKFAELELSNDLELQQRAGEMLRLLQAGKVADSVLAPLPPAEEEKEEEHIKLVQPMTQQDDNDLLLLVMDDEPPKSTEGVLDQLMENVTKENNTREPGAAVWLRNDEIEVYARTQVNPKDSRQYAVQLSAYANGKRDLEQFAMKIDCSNGWQWKAAPADGMCVRPGEQPVRQVFYLFNSMNTNLIDFRLVVSYMFGSQPVTETAVVKSFQ